VAARERSLYEALDFTAQAHHLVNGPDADSILLQTGDLFRPHARAGGNDQAVERHRALRGHDFLFVRVHVLDPRLDEINAGAPCARRDGEHELLRRQPKWDVDGIGLEQEVRPVRHDRDLGTVAQAPLQIVGTLQSAESSTEHDNALHHTLLSFRRRSPSPRR
jgi:hypothetical protein